MTLSEPLVVTLRVASAFDRLGLRYLIVTMARAYGRGDRHVEW
jgi:hypothetical protein